MELKKTISRSYARKLTDGNYGSTDYFANYSEEIDANSTPEHIAEVSVLLYDMARGDVEKAMKSFPDVDEETRKQLKQTDWVLQEKFDKLKNLAKTGINYQGSMEDYQEVCEAIPEAKNIINELKKEYKRSDAYKSTLQPREKNAVSMQK